jgi:hypothetical protein
MHHQVTSTEMLFSHHNDAFRSSSLFRPKRTCGFGSRNERYEPDLEDSFASLCRSDQAFQRDRVTR